MDAGNNYPRNFFALDDDNDSIADDYIFDARFHYIFNYPTGASVNAIHYAFDIDNDNDPPYGITISPQLKNYTSSLAAG
ncbi:MAG: hypothetical protein PHP14_02980 [Candidatus Pacebacteria bacterium]|nr:hypothetical protein [Candidatus Paceibacterota bacterium]